MSATSRVKPGLGSTHVGGRRWMRTSIAVALAPPPFEGICGAHGLCSEERGLGRCLVGNSLLFLGREGSRCACLLVPGVGRELFGDGSAADGAEGVA